MAMEPRISPLLRAWYKWKSLRLPWRRQFLVGLDLNGNTYWEFVDRGTRPPSSSTTSATPSPGAPRQVRWRRIVRCPRGTPHDAVAVSPAWHQWLRHTRAEPPTLEEQRADVERQARIKVLAAEADARWEAKPRLAADGAGASMARLGLGVRGPATLTGSGGGPGSTATATATATADKSASGGVAGEGEGEGEGAGGGTRTTGVAGVGDRDSEVVDQREETWGRTQEAAGAKESEKNEKGPAEHDPWKQARGGPSETWQPQAWEPTARPKK